MHCRRGVRGGGISRAPAPSLDARYSGKRRRTLVPLGGGVDFSERDVGNMFGVKKVAGHILV